MTDQKQKPETQKQSMPKRIQRKRTKGYRMPDGAKSVARPSRWGNPYRVEDCESRAACLEKFEAYVQRRLREDPDWLAPLRGYDLACYCALDEQCHADVLLEYANQPIRHGD
jgi:hypothetical protein